MRIWRLVHMVPALFLFAFFPQGVLTGQQAPDNSLPKVLGAIRFADQFCNTPGTLDDSCVTNAINSITVNLANANGVVYLPAGVYTFHNSVTIPDKVRVIGAARRAVIVSWSGAGNAFTLKPGTTYAGIEGLRISLGRNPRSVGIGISCSNRESIRWNTLRDIEIGGSNDGNTNLAGQIGLNIVADVDCIITSNWFEDVDFFCVDIPLIKTNTEGNFFRNITIEEWGAKGDVHPIAINSVSHDDEVLARISGGKGSNPIGYREAGTSNVAQLVADMLLPSAALDLTGSGNTVILSRPLLNTPIGTVGQNTLIDDTGIASSGFIALGTTTVASLPPAGAGNAGQIIKVSDSTPIASEGQTCVGGSTNIALAFSNGSVWKCF